MATRNFYSAKRVLRWSVTGAPFAAFSPIHLQIGSFFRLSLSLPLSRASCHPYPRHMRPYRPSPWIHASIPPIQRNSERMPKNARHSTRRKEYRSNATEDDASLGPYLYAYPLITKQLKDQYTLVVRKRRTAEKEPSHSSEKKKHILPGPRSQVRRRRRRRRWWRP